MSLKVCVWVGEVVSLFVRLTWVRMLTPVELRLLIGF